MAQIIIVILVGIGLFLLGFKQSQKSRAARSWPKAPGIISSAALRSDNSSSDPEMATVSLALEYRFTVSGQEYVGHKIQFVERVYSTNRQAKAALAKYPAGCPVEVFFDPQNPANCILKQGNSFSWVLMILGAAAILLSIASMFK
jgi:hypothetical protein